MKKIKKRSVISLMVMSSGEYVLPIFLKNNNQQTMVCRLGAAGNGVANQEGGRQGERLWGECNEAHISSHQQKTGEET
jgi:hypothetical protein